VLETNERPPQGVGGLGTRKVKWRAKAQLEGRPSGKLNDPQPDPKKCAGEVGKGRFRRDSKKLASS